MEALIRPHKKQKVVQGNPLVHAASKRSVGTGSRNRGAGFVVFSSNAHDPDPTVQMLLRYLSNSARVPGGIVYNGLTFPTVSNAYNAQKIIHLEGEQEESLIRGLQKRFTVSGDLKTPKGARQAMSTTSPDSILTQRNLVLDSESWEYVKSYVMEELLLARFEQDPKFRRLLLNISRRGLALFYHEKRSKCFWGGSFDEETSAWSGENVLGELLQKMAKRMRHRDWLLCISYNNLLPLEGRGMQGHFPGEKLWRIQGVDGLEARQIARKILKENIHMEDQQSRLPGACVDHILQKLLVYEADEEAQGLRPWGKVGQPIEDDGYLAKGYDWFDGDFFRGYTLVKKGKGDSSEKTFGSHSDYPNVPIW